MARLTLSKHISAVTSASVLILSLATTLTVFWRNRDLQGRLDDAHRHLTAYHTIALTAMTSSYALTGGRLNWPQTVRPLAAESQPSSGLSVILFVTTIGCDECVEAETAFGSALAKRFGPTKVAVVMSAPNRRFVDGYAHRYNIMFPVFVDEQDEFVSAVGIKYSPTLLLVSDRSQIIGSLVPSPGNPEFSQAFHDLCIRLMERERGTDLAAHTALRR